MSLARKGNVTCMKRKLNAPCKKGKIFARKGNMKEKQSFLAKKEHMHRHALHSLLLGCSTVGF